MADDSFNNYYLLSVTIIFGCTTINKNKNRLTDTSLSLNDTGSKYEMKKNSY